MLTLAPLILAAVAAPDGVDDALPPLPPALVAPTVPVSPPASFWQMVIEQQIIIRVPARRSPLTNFSSAPPAERPREMPIVWKEKKAPKCVAMRDVMGMQAVQRDSIDLITRQNERLRAQLNRGCRALDFYAGFYMKGNKDGRLCEDRDEIHARTGARCEIDKFRLLVPVRPDDD